MALPSDWLKTTLVTSSPQKDHFYNVFYWKPDAAPTYTPAPMTDSLFLAIAAAALLTSHTAAVMTTNTTIVGINAELHVGGIVYDTSYLINQPGTLSVDELADFEAVVIQKRTSVAGKSGRGRWYLGPVPETLTDENYLTAAAYPLYTAVMTDWCGNFMELGVNWLAQLYSKKTNNLYGISSGYVDNKVGQIGGRKSHSIL